MTGESFHGPAQPVGVCPVEIRSQTAILPIDFKKRLGQGEVAAGAEAGLFHGFRPVDDDPSSTVGVRIAGAD